MSRRALRSRQRFDKYRIERRIGSGAFAHVYQAFDTVEQIHVAIKLLPTRWEGEDCRDSLLKEVRVAARLRHPNILPIKDARFIDDRFAIVTPLGTESLADRLGRRLAHRTALTYAEQMLEAVAFAHEKRVLHCDLKPQNFVVFPTGLQLCDFGLAKRAFRTIAASGSGTLGYTAPEQAMGRPSARSDVFSLGLILIQMFGGTLLEWPFEWPPKGLPRMQRKLPRELIGLLRRSVEVSTRRRFPDATSMLAEFRKRKGETPSTAEAPSRTRHEKATCPTCKRALAR